MYTVSRFIIFVPIIIFILSLYVHYSTPRQSLVVPTPIPTIQPGQSITETFSKSLVSSSGERLNLRGPYKCDFTDNELQISAFIQNKKIFVQFNQQNQSDYLLINGDCGYKWKKGENSGGKMCGIGQYISLFETFSGMPFVSIDSLFSMLSQYSPSTSMSSSQASAVAKSCKKEPVEDSVFTIPSKVIFSDIQSVSPAVR